LNTSARYFFPGVNPVIVCVVAEDAASLPASL